MRFPMTNSTPTRAAQGDGASARTSKENLDALRKALGPVLFNKVFTAEQIERYEKGEQHFFLSVPLGGKKYDYVGIKDGPIQPVKTSEERAQEVHSGLRSFSMLSFVVPLRKEGAVTDSDVGPLIQFGLKNMRAMILMGEPDYGTLTEPENESTLFQLKYAMEHKIPVIPIDLCMNGEYHTTSWPPSGTKSFPEFSKSQKRLDGLRGKDPVYGWTIWDHLALAEAIASQLPRDLNFNGNVFLKPGARFCVATFPGIFSGDFGAQIDSNDPNLCMACVFQADGGEAQFIGPKMTSVKGERHGDHWQDSHPMVKGELPKGKSCPDSCWCTELEGAGTVDKNGQKVGCGGGRIGMVGSAHAESRDVDVVVPNTDSQHSQRVFRGTGTS